MWLFTLLNNKVYLLSINLGLYLELNKVDLWT